MSSVLPVEKIGNIRTHPKVPLFEVRKNKKGNEEMVEKQKRTLPESYPGLPGGAHDQNTSDVGLWASAVEASPTKSTIYTHTGSASLVLDHVL